MPELPEVEVLVRHLRPLVRGRRILSVQVRRPRVLRPTTPAKFAKTLAGAKIHDLTRRGKYLLFELRLPQSREKLLLLGHLGMTGRMYLAGRRDPLPKHAAVILELGTRRFIYEDTRYFGRLTLDLTSLHQLGPEPWDPALTPETFLRELKKSRQPVKVKLLDQTLIAGVGNIYASESLYRARISPRRPANRLTLAESTRLLAAIREVLDQAITGGSTIPLNFSGGKTGDLFYFGVPAESSPYYTERLHVYDRAGQPCVRCATPIRRAVQAARSTFWCPQCQKS